MKKIFCSIIIVVLLLQSCNSQHNKKYLEKEIFIHTTFGDSVITFLNEKKDTLKIFRKIEIMENSNNDTLILGYSIIPPKYTGEITFIQDGLDSSEAFYIENKSLLLPNDEANYTKLFSISIWKNKQNAINKIKIKVKLK